MRSMPKRCDGSSSPRIPRTSIREGLLQTLQHAD
jgi:hypothetical protein